MDGSHPVLHERTRKSAPVGTHITLNGAFGGRRQGLSLGFDAPTLSEEVNS